MRVNDGGPGHALFERDHMRCSDRCEHTKLNSRQAWNALLSTIAFAGNP
jgi:hypothetical protein